ncbi:MAG: ATP-binding protein [Erysipelotrichaceae bacterium]|nr:ATP-binding protein [Erysipelotrichaceae bacterium]
MRELTIDATIENIPVVTGFVDESLEELECPLKAQMQIDIAIDELFGNIANYAYKPDVGPATVRVEVEEDPLAVIITFIDHGRPFDPLGVSDPDTTLKADERKIGGLGVFLVKKTMDELSYEYIDGKNILRIRKKLKSEKKHHGLF